MITNGLVEIVYSSSGDILVVCPIFYMNIIIVYFKLYIWQQIGRSAHLYYIL